MLLLIYSYKDFLGLSLYYFLIFGYMWCILFPILDIMGQFRWNKWYLDENNNLHCSLGHRDAWFNTQGLKVERGFPQNKHTPKWPGIHADLLLLFSWLTHLKKVSLGGYALCGLAFTSMEVEKQISYLNINFEASAYLSLSCLGLWPTLFLVSDGSYFLSEPSTHSQIIDVICNVF